MKQKSVNFLYELHRQLFAQRQAQRSTFVFAESMDDFCLTIGYASAVAAYDDLPIDIKQYVHMTKNKSNPLFYAHVAFISTPADILFTDVADPETNESHLIMNISLDDTTIAHLKKSYV